VRGENPQCTIHRSPVFRENPDIVFDNRTEASRFDYVILRVPDNEPNPLQCIDVNLGLT